MYGESPRSQTMNQQHQQSGRTLAECFESYPEVSPSDIDGNIEAKVPDFGGDSETVPAVNGWEVVDTTDYVIENVNEMARPTETITDIIEWEGERNNAPIPSLYALKYDGRRWSLKRENIFKWVPNLVDNTVIMADSKAGIIAKAIAWQDNNPVKTASAMLNPPVEE